MSRSGSVSVILLLPLVFLVLVVSFTACTTSSPSSTWIGDRDEMWKQRLQNMFEHAYSSYMKFAHPQDELRPLSCDGIDSFGGLTVTLIDTLDSLLVFGMKEEFRNGVRWIIEHINFEKNATVSVFETNIRVLGGLLSAHLLAMDENMDVFPEYRFLNRNLLDLAIDLGHRLVRAFSTRTGIPYGAVNLKFGVPPGETTITATACAGTFLLEFGVLSSLSGNSTFAEAAVKAMDALFARRSHIGLLGNHIDISSGRWTHAEAGIGANIDSTFEYALKAYILFRESKWKHMFDTYSESIKKYLKQGPWYYDVHMDTGHIVWSLYNSLQSFWPGLQTLSGEIHEASETLRAFHGVYRLFGAVPEGFNVPSGMVQSGQRGYPLRPELAESLYYLYRATRDSFYKEAAKDMIISLELHTRVKCGYTGLEDVEMKTPNNRMESFFLSETLKYLYILFDEDNFINRRFFIFNTEAHPFPISYRFHNATGSAASEDLEAPTWRRTQVQAYSRIPRFSESLDAGGVYSDRVSQKLAQE